MRRSACLLLLAATLAVACFRPLPPPRVPQATGAARDSALARAAADSARLLRSFDVSLVPPRPRLTGAAPDTNDPARYYAHGMEVFDRDPTEAAEAFAWAARLEPSYAQAYYNWWLALQQRRRDRPFESGGAAGRPTEAERRRIDSLLTTAFALNPFVETAAGDAMQAGQWYDDTRLGRRDYARGKYASAIKLWGRVLARNPTAIDVRVWRARAMFVLRRFDDAAQELTIALEVVRRAELDSAHYVAPVAKELLSYGIGLLHAQRGDRASAREAYEQAIADNLGFYMAHARLAGLALLDHDTTTALVEYETATSIRGDDPALRAFYGYALFQARHLDDAERQLREATRLDPDYAMPYVWLGRVLDARGDPGGAAAAYAAFLARARRTDAEVPAVRARLAAGPPAAIR